MKLLFFNQLTPSMKYKINAIELIKLAMEKRNWHHGKITATSAGQHKLNAAKGKLSYEKSCELLEIAGYRKVEEESWEKIPTAPKPPKVL